MTHAEQGMNDYSQIMLPNGQFLKPIDTVAYHMSFVESLRRWLEDDLPGKRVVIQPSCTGGESEYSSSRIA